MCDDRSTFSFLVLTGYEAHLQQYTGQQHELELGPVHQSNQQFLLEDRLVLPRKFLERELFRFRKYRFKKLEHVFPKAS